MTDMPSLLGLASDAARHAAFRQTVIARNVANADTPGWKASDVAPFHSGDGAMPLRRSDPRHLAGRAPGPRAEPVADVPADPNGNTVSLQDQILRSVEAARAHGRALAVYRASLDLMRASLGKG